MAPRFTKVDKFNHYKDLMELKFGKLLEMIIVRTCMLILGETEADFKNW